MFRWLTRLFTENIGLKLLALAIALLLWFYIVNELKKGSEEERILLKRIIPQEGISAKKLVIKPIFIGKVRNGYQIAMDKVFVVPEYCIVVGTKELLGKIKFAYTIPVDLASSYKTITKSVPLNPIAPGVYMEETLVQVTVPIEKISQ